MSDDWLKLYFYLFVTFWSNQALFDAKKRLLEKNVSALDIEKKREFFWKRKKKESDVFAHHVVADIIVHLIQGGFYA